MSSIERVNKDLKVTLLSHDAEITKQRALMLMKMEHMQEKINYYRKREESLRKEQKSLKKILERKETSGSRDKRENRRSSSFKTANFNGTERNQAPVKENLRKSGLQHSL